MAIALAVLMASGGCGGSDRTSGPSSVPAPAPARWMLGEDAHFVQVARFGSGRAVAAAEGGGVIEALSTTLGVSVTRAGSPSEDVPTSLAVPVDEVKLSGPGNALVLRSDDGDIELWSVERTPALLTSMGDVRAVEFVDDDTIVASTEFGFTYVSVHDGTVLSTVRLPSETSDGAVVRAVLDPDGEHAVLGVDGAMDSGGRLVGWSLVESAPRWSVDVGGVASTKRWDVGVDGRTLVVEDLDVQLVDGDGAVVSSWHLDGDDSVTEVVALEQTRGFAIVRSAGSVMLTDAAGAPRVDLPSPGLTLVDVSEVAGEPGVVTVDFDGVVRNWDLAGVLVSTTKDHAAGEVNEVAVSHRGDQASFATSDGVVGVVELTAGGAPVLPAQLQHDEGNVDTVTFDPTDTVVLTGISEPNGELSFDDTLTSWNVAEGTRRYAVAGVPRYVMGCIAFRNKVRFSPDGSDFAAPFHDFSVSLRDADDGHVIHEFPAHRSIVWDLAFSPDGTQLVTASDDWTVRVWGLDTYALDAEFETVPGGYLAIGLLPDGRSLLTSDISGAMRILDTVDGSLSAPFESSKHPQARLGVSPDGRYVAAGADDAGSIRIWDVATGAVVAELTGHRGAVNSVEFTPDGLGLVSGSDDGTVRLWQLRT